MSMDITRKTKLFRVVILGVTLIVSLVIVCSAVLIFLFLKSSSKSGIDDNDERTFRYFRTNPVSNESYVGFISAKPYNTLIDQNNPSVFYMDGKGFYNLISQFDSSIEYKCIGKCVCSENHNDERRSISVPVIKSGLLYLVTALTSIVAFNKAKEYYEDLCEMEMTKIGDCNGIITSEVDECAPIHKENNKEEESGKFELRNIHKDSYVCSGRCVKLNARRIANDILKESARKTRQQFIKLYEKLQNDKKCAQLALTKTYHVNQVEKLEERLLAVTQLRMDLLAMQEKSDVARAMFDFVNGVKDEVEFVLLIQFVKELDVFCMGESKHVFTEIESDEWLILCAGYNHDLMKNVEYHPTLNPRVKCLKMLK